jgi:hypothetical protein
MEILDKDAEVSERVIQFVDPNVLASMKMCSNIIIGLTFMAELPEGSISIGIYPYGATYWTRTAEIQTRQADGSQLSFFLKVLQVIFSNVD